MLIVAALILGACFGTAGMFAKQLNSAAGMGISHKAWHGYFTMLGGLSNLILPIISIIIVMAMVGITDGLLAALMIAAGAFGAGLLRPSYYTKLLIALLGVPFALGLFVLSLLA